MSLKIKSLSALCAGSILPVLLTGCGTLTTPSTVTEYVQKNCLFQII